MMTGAAGSSWGDVLMSNGCDNDEDDDEDDDDEDDGEEADGVEVGNSENKQLENLLQKLLEIAKSPKSRKILLSAFKILAEEFEISKPKKGISKARRPATKKPAVDDAAKRAKKEQQDEEKRLRQAKAEKEKLDRSTANAEVKAAVAAARKEAADKLIEPALLQTAKGKLLMWGWDLKQATYGTEGEYLSMEELVQLAIRANVFDPTTKLTAKKMVMIKQTLLTCMAFLKEHL